MVNFLWVILRYILVAYALLVSSFRRPDIMDRPMTEDIYILKTEPRKNLVFGWANVPLPVEKVFTDVAPDGSLEDQLVSVEGAFRAQFPSVPEENVWTHVVATFKDSLIAEISKDGNASLFKYPYKAKKAGVEFSDPEEVTMEFVTKAITENLVQRTEPKTDLQGDRVDPEALEDAVYEFVQKSRTASVDHTKIGVGSLVESLVITPEKLTAMGIPEELHSQINKGWWVGFRVDDEMMAKVDSGEYTMFSIGGTAAAKLSD